MSRTRVIWCSGQDVWFCGQERSDIEDKSDFWRRRQEWFDVADKREFRATFKRFDLADKSDLILRTRAIWYSRQKWYDADKRDFMLWTRAKLDDADKSDLLSRRQERRRCCWQDQTDFYVRTRAIWCRGQEWFDVVDKSHLTLQRRATSEVANKSDLIWQTRLIWYCRQEQLLLLRTREIW